MSNEYLERLREFGEIISNIWNAVINGEIAETEALELITTIGKDAA